MPNDNHITPVVLALAISLLVLCPTFSADKQLGKPPLGEQIFKQNCASCHSAGGNTVKPAKPVANSNKLATLGVFKQYLTNPLGHMPYYKHILSNDKVLKDLYDYCKTLKQPIKQAMADPQSKKSF